ncbi:hypothetical protein BC829DRAFT_493426 [Chytridium lagenaria]|nr:hypothetical protein BC829DRAFT_493426 [Chytridium lagenaria]
MAKEQDDTTPPTPQPPTPQTLTTNPLLKPKPPSASLSESVPHVPPQNSTSPPTINNQKETYDYRFHHVFDEKAGQEEVFDKVAKGVVGNVLEGYNGTIFAYGQTGSGKTFTITGGAERYEDRGLIPRTLQYMFKETKNRPGHHYDISISYLEIYNENGYDLLDSTRDAKKLEDLPKVRLLEDSDQNIHLQNLSLLPALSEEEALNHLFVGDTNRMIAETPSNPASSRSHCIFIITVTSRRDNDDRIRRSKLHLVDLAGSERTSRTGINGKLFTEASYINLSLHYLEQVIVALYEKDLGNGVIVLRDSLGGNCMTTMVATVAPEDELIDESISTCRFAQRVALISNKAHVNEEIDPHLLIAKLRKEIALLKAEIALLRGGTEEEVLPDYEKQRVRELVDGFVEEGGGLVVAEFGRIQEAFRVFREYVLEARKGGGEEGRRGRTGGRDGGGEEVEGVDYILIGMINQYKEQMGDTPIEKKTLQSSETLGGSRMSLGVSQSSETLGGSRTNLGVSSMSLVEDKPPARPPAQPRAPVPNLGASVPQFTTEKARAFEIFKNGYPSGSWIDGQKMLLRTKYAEAKALGEEANRLRTGIKHLKEKLSAPPSDEEPIEDRVTLRTDVAAMVVKYRDAYQRLKDLKIEIEHLQHLLEQARVRLTRDFEHWYLNVYLATGGKEEVGGDAGRRGGGEDSLDPLTPQLSSMSLASDISTISSTMPSAGTYQNPPLPVPSTRSQQQHQQQQPPPSFISNINASTTSLSSQNTAYSSVTRPSPNLNARPTPTLNARPTPPPPPPLMYPTNNNSIISRPSQRIPISLALTTPKTPHSHILLTIHDPTPANNTLHLDHSTVASDVEAFYKARHDLVQRAASGVETWEWTWDVEKTATRGLLDDIRMTATMDQKDHVVVDGDAHAPTPTLITTEKNITPTSSDSTLDFKVTTRSNDPSSSSSSAASVHSLDKKASLAADAAADSNDLIVPTTTTTTTTTTIDQQQLLELGVSKDKKDVADTDPSRLYQPDDDGFVKYPASVLVPLFVGLISAHFLAALDATIVSTALVAISTEALARNRSDCDSSGPVSSSRELPAFNAQKEIAWVATSYVLTFNAFQPLVGKFSQIFGHRILTLAGIIIFVIGSALCGAATGINMLIAARAIQGIGGAALISMVLISISDMFPSKNVQSTSLSSGSISVSPPSSVPFSEVPLPTKSPGAGVSTLTSPIPFKPVPFKEQVKRIDFLGTVWLLIAVILILIPTSLGGVTIPWNSPAVIACFVCAAVAITILIIIELKVKEPIIPPHVFKNRNVLFVFICNFFLGMCFFAFVFYGPQYFQLVRGDSATIAGLQLLPLLLGGAYWFSTLDQHSSRAAEIGALLLVGIGLGFQMQMAILCAQASVDQSDTGTVSALASFFQSIGGGIGLAILSAIFNDRYVSGIAALPEELRAAFSNPSAEGEGIRGRLLKSCQRRYSVPFACVAVVASCFISWKTRVLSQEEVERNGPSH